MMAGMVAMNFKNITIMGGTYYEQTRFISNSNLSELRRVMNLQEPGIAGSFLGFGNLVDARFTEPHRVSEFAITDDELTLAERMYEAGIADSTLALYMQRAQKQHEVYKLRHPVEWEGDRVYIPARCKFDFRDKPLRSGADLKTTACTSQKAFTESIYHFSYDRAAAWYMDLDGLDTFMIIGIGKKPKRHSNHHPVFKFAIRRGDPVHVAGQYKYNFLAYQYYHLIYNLNLQL